MQKATKNTDWSSLCYHNILYNLVTILTNLGDGPIEQGGQTNHVDIPFLVIII
jgi:hypothetical protein